MKGAIQIKSWDPTPWPRAHASVLIESSGLSLGTGCPDGPGALRANGREVRELHREEVWHFLGWEGGLGTGSQRAGCLFPKMFLHFHTQKICNFTRISVLPISLLGDLTRLNQFDSFPWLVGTPSGVSQRTYPDYSPPLSHTREPGLEKWAEHLHLSWIRWTLSESNDCCSNKRTSTRIVTPSSNTAPETFRRFDLAALFRGIQNAYIRHAVNTRLATMLPTPAPTAFSGLIKNRRWFKKYQQEAFFYFFFHRAYKKKAQKPSSIGLNAYVRTIYNHFSHTYIQIMYQKK